MARYPRADNLPDRRCTERLHLSRRLVLRVWGNFRIRGAEAQPRLLVQMRIRGGVYFEWKVYLNMTDISYVTTTLSSLSGVLSMIPHGAAVAYIAEDLPGNIPKCERHYHVVSGGFSTDFSSCFYLKGRTITAEVFHGLFGMLGHQTVADFDHCCKGWAGDTH